MKVNHKIGLVMLVLLTGIQFIPVQLNQKKTDENIDFIKIYIPPTNIISILDNACYDCHSNQTKYPWYSRLQPGAMFMEWHIVEGKKELNLSEFGSYSERKQKSKLKSMIKQIQKQNMPLSSYKWLHEEAKLTEPQKNELIQFLNSI